MTAKLLKDKVVSTLDGIRPLGATAVELTAAITGPSPEQLARVCRLLVKLEKTGLVTRSGPPRNTYWRAVR